MVPWSRASSRNDLVPKTESLLTVDIIEEQPLPIAAALVVNTLETAFRTFRPTTITTAMVELLFTDDEHMQSLNNTYRKVNATTDVLSLPTAVDSALGIVVPVASNPTHLGTIVISLPQATRQIGRFGATLEAELIGLAEHGLRHLLGHDHNELGKWL